MAAYTQATTTLPVGIHPASQGLAANLNFAFDAGVQGFERLIGELTGDEVEALVAALPALKHLAELESQDREGPKQ